VRRTFCSITAHARLWLDRPPPADDPQWGAGGTGKTRLALRAAADAHVCSIDDGPGRLATQFSRTSGFAPYGHPPASGHSAVAVRLGRQRRKAILSTGSHADRPSVPRGACHRSAICVNHRRSRTNYVPAHDRAMSSATSSAHSPRLYTNNGRSGRTSGSNPPRSTSRTRPGDSRRLGRHREVLETPGQLHHHRGAGPAEKELHL
jgi:hypothetical protein